MVKRLQVLFRWIRHIKNILETYNSILHYLTSTSRKKPVASQPRRKRKKPPISAMCLLTLDEFSRTLSSNPYMATRSTDVACWHFSSIRRPEDYFR